MQMPKMIVFLKAHAILLGFYVGRAGVWDVSIKQGWENELQI